MAIALTSEAIEGGIQLDWNASLLDGVIGYKIFRDSSLIATIGADAAEDITIPNDALWKVEKSDNPGVFTYFPYANQLVVSRPGGAGSWFKAELVNNDHSTLEIFTQFSNAVITKITSSETVGLGVNLFSPKYGNFAKIPLDTVDNVFSFNALNKSLIIVADDYFNADGGDGYTMTLLGLQVGRIPLRFVDNSVVEGDCYDYSVQAFTEATLHSGAVNFTDEGNPWIFQKVRSSDGIISYFDPSANPPVSMAVNDTLELVQRSGHAPVDPFLTIGRKYQMEGFTTPAVDGQVNFEWINPSTGDSFADLINRNPNWPDYYMSSDLKIAIFSGLKFKCLIASSVSIETIFTLIPQTEDSNTINQCAEVVAPVCIASTDQEAFIPFKFYDDIKKQNRNKRHCRGQAVYELITPSNKVLPFFITRTDNHSFPASIKIFDLDGDVVLDITSGLTYELLTDGVTQYLFYYGTIISGMSLTCGFYYIVVEFCDTEKYYSEVFAPKNFTSNDEDQPYILLEWKHSKNVSNLIYQTGYLNRLYIDSFLAEPTYELEQEGDENNEKDFIPTFQRGVKTYKIELTPVPEYITDALFLINAHDNKKLIADNFIITDFKDAAFETKWIDSGCLATGILSFRKYPAVISRTCGDNLDLEPVTVPVDCTQFKGFTLQQVIDSHVRLKDILDCTLNDFIP